jgi:hypothetical protein
MMKKITTLFFMIFIGVLVLGQTNDLSINYRWSTKGTGAKNAGKWAKIAECNITGAWQDFGSTFEFFGNGGYNSYICYGKIITRFKNQSNAVSPVNYYNLVLFDSNISSENVKAVRKGTKVELYIRIPFFFTTIFFRQILNGGGPMIPLEKQDLLSELPVETDDLVIGCLDGGLPKNAVDNFKVSGDDNPYFLVSNTNSSENSEAIIKAAYSYDGTAKIRSARVELGSHDNKGDEHYGKVWSLESVTGNTWANAPEFRINLGKKEHFCIDYLGNVGIGKTADTSTKLDVAGTIRATEIKVEAQTADFVFDENYPLRSLDEVEEFIKTRGHLPSIPSAERMEKNGVNLAEMNKLLLQKIEELTLYAIEREKEVRELKAEGNRQKERLEQKEMDVEELAVKVESQEKRLIKVEALLLEK